MIHHLILLSESQDLRVEAGRLISGEKKIAIETLGSVQCLATSCRWSQTALESLVSACPVVMARWDKQQKKWRTFSLQPRARYVNPNALWKLCRLSPQRATQLASGLLWTKVCNQHEMLRSFDPRMTARPQLRENSFNRILRLEAQYARFFWPRYFGAMAQDLFEREKRKPDHPLNAALNYGYGFLYHALEWQCMAAGLDPGIGIIHKLRRSRPSLACDLIEPLRCCVELTVMRHWDDMKEPKQMAGHFAEMLETKWIYRENQYRLRSVIRLMVESFVRALDGKATFAPFVLQPRDACL
jgi:CRISPR-associated endonuclease Cas1